MKLQERLPLSTTPRRRTHRRLRITLTCLILAIVVLVAAVATLAIRHTLTVRDHEAQSQALSNQLTDLQTQLDTLTALHEDTVSALQADISDKEEQLAQHAASIAALKKQIAALKKATTTTAKTTTGKGSTTKKTTTAKPSKVTVPVVADKADKLIALTFDDGPNPATTPKLLDALKKRGVKATFFVLGSNINSTTAPIIKRMEAEGHVVANHSQNHKNLRYQSAAGIKKEMDACSNKLKSILGHKPTLMRAPGGNYNNKVKAYAQGAGMAIIQWSVDTRDWESRNVKSILNTAFNNNYSKIQDGSIVLMHDIYSTTVEAAIKMVDRLEKEGYTLVTVPELLTLRKGGAVAGQVYNSAGK